MTVAFIWRKHVHAININFSTGNVATDYFMIDETGFEPLIQKRRFTKIVSKLPKFSSVIVENSL